MVNKIFFVFVAAILVIVSFASSASSSGPTLPRSIVFTSYSVGTSVYTVSSAFAEGIMKLCGTSVKVIPASTDAGRLVPLQQGTSQGILLSSLSHYDMVRGVGKTFGEWGPQKLRTLIHAYDVPTGLASRGDSGLKPWEDLKGKKCAVVAGVSASETWISSLLAFCGLTLNDVKVKKVSGGHGVAYKSIFEKKIDFGYICPGTPTTLEMEATYGITWWEMPPDDKERWARLKEIAPYIVPVTITKNGATLEHPLKIGGVYP